jgi:glycosidase
MINLSKDELFPGESVALSLKLYAPSAALPVISWSAQAGGIAPTRVANEAVYTAPETAGDYEILVKAVVGDSSYETQSIVRVRKPSPDGKGRNAADYVGQGQIQNRQAALSIMYADSTPLYLSPSEPEALSPVLFKLRLPAGLPGSTRLHIRSAEGETRTVAMAKQKGDSPAFNFYLAEAWPTRYPFEYWFEWSDGSDSIYLSRAGASIDVPKASDLFSVDSGRKIPLWAKGLCLYRIVPDRFYNADFSNDPKGTRTEWNTAIAPGEASKPLGGDIEGITRKLEYLRTLGVDALLIDPLFGGDLKVEGRYSQTDLSDPDQKLADFITRTRARGLKVILDTDIPGLDMKAKEKDFLVFAQGWVNKSMAAGLRPPKMTGKSADAFYPQFRDQLKSANPDTVLLSPFSSKDRGAWDLSDEYDDPNAFSSLISGFLTGRDLGGKKSTAAKGDGLLFLRSIAQAQASMPQSVLSCAVLALDEPGFARLATRLEANEREEKGNTGQENTDSNPDSDLSWLAAYREAVLFQMSLPGAPLILYGGETALEGAAQADSLRGYPWGRENKELIALYRDLNGLRKSYSALRTGSYHSLSANAAGLVSYLRWDIKSKLIIAVNGSKDPQTLEIDAALAGMQNGDRLRAVFSFTENGHSLSGPSYSVKDGKLAISLSSRSGMIILCPSPKEISPSVEKRPQLRRIFPADKAKDLAPDTRIIMEFSEEMEQSSILEAFRILPEVKGSFVWNGYTCTFVPEGQFEPKTDYSVSLDKELRSSSGGFALKEGRNFSFSVK